MNKRRRQRERFKRRDLINRRGGLTFDNFTKPVFHLVYTDTGDRASAADAERYDLWKKIERDRFNKRCDIDWLERRVRENKKRARRWREASRIYHEFYARLAPRTRAFFQQFKVLSSDPTIRYIEPIKPYIQEKRS